MKQSPLRQELHELRKEMREEFRLTRQEFNNHKHGQYVPYSVAASILVAIAGYLVFA